MNLERKKRILIDIVMTRFTCSYRVKEMASDAALKEMEQGLGLLDSMQLAEAYVSELA